MYTIVLTTPDGGTAYGPYPDEATALVALRAWHVSTEMDSDPDADRPSLEQATLDDIRQAYAGGDSCYTITLGPLTPLL